jgi:hypothetical protein
LKTACASRAGAVLIALAPSCTNPAFPGDATVNRCASVRKFATDENMSAAGFDPLVVQFALGD